MMERSKIQLPSAPAFVAKKSCLDDGKMCQKHVCNERFYLFLFFLEEMTFENINFVLQDIMAYLANLFCVKLRYCQIAQYIFEEIWP